MDEIDMVKIEPLAHDGILADGLCRALYLEIEKEHESEWLYLPYSKPSSFEEFLSFLENLVKEKTIPYAILRESDERPSGLVCQVLINQSGGVFEIGHVFFTQAARRSNGSIDGIAAIHLLLKQCFNSAARRVQWRCHHLNLSSRRLAFLLGFEQEGIFRQTDFYKGMSRDTVWFSVIDTQWPDVELRLAELTMIRLNQPN